jgi:nucleoside-diphosphate-sugar epimerase
MKVIITGATGFVGSNLCQSLKSLHEIESLSVRYSQKQEFTIKSDAIIHLAGKAHDLKKVSSPQDYYDANFELTKQLFNAFLDSDAKIFIFMSTVKAAADQVEGILTEDTVENPKTHYGIAKLQAEKYILSKELPEWKKVYILRPSMIHGPGNKGNLNLLYQLVSKGIPWPLGAFENQRSFLSIENLCFVIKNLLENKKIPSGVYHIADDISLSTKEVITLLGKSIGKESIVVNVNSTLIKAIAKFGDYCHLPLNSERLQKLTENYLVSNKKIILALGKSLPLSSREGLMKTFESFRKNN